MLPNVAKAQTRLLSKFVGAVRQAPSQEVEKELVTAELAEIRKSFLNAADLTAEDRCRLLLHLLYISTLGYPIDSTGSHEALNLLASNDANIRSLAFMMLSLMYADDSDVVGFLGLRLEPSLKSTNSFEVCAALSAMSTMMNPQMVAPLFPLISGLANPANRRLTAVRRRAYIVLLKMYQRDPNILPTSVWAARFAKSLEDEEHEGCIMSLCNLIYGILLKQSTIIGLERLFVYALNKLKWLRSTTKSELIYYEWPCPWIEVKLWRILQVFPCPQDTKLLQELESLLSSRFEAQMTSLSLSQKDTGTPLTSEKKSAQAKKIDKTHQKKSNESNAAQIIIYETLEAITHFHQGLSIDLLRKAVELVSAMIAQKESHSRFIGLQMMSKLASIRSIHSTLSRLVEPILTHLNDSDPAMRKQTIELLFILCNPQNWELVVSRLMSCLWVETDENVIEDIPLKVVVLCERFCSNLNQFVETCLELLGCAPTSNVWRRVVQVVTGFVARGRSALTEEESEKQEALQTNTVILVYERLKRSWPKEKSLLQLSVYLMGEFGYLLVDHEPPVCTYHTLMSVFVSAFQRTKDPDIQSMALVAMAKLYNSCNSEDSALAKKRHHHHENLEVQQRAVELYSLCQQNSDILENVLALMPAYPATLSSEAHLMSKLVKTKRIKPTLALPPGMQRTNQSRRESSSSRSVASHSETSSGPGASHSAAPSSSSAASSAAPSSTASDESSSSESDDSSASASSNKKSRRPLDPNSPVALWRAACITPQGCLRNAPPLLVRTMRQVKDAMARLMINLQNTSQQPIRLVSATPLVSTPYVAVQEPVPVVPNQIIAPGASMNHTVDFRHLQPGHAPLRWSLVIGEARGTRTIPINLVMPIAAFHFITPVKMVEPVLQTQWTKLQPSPKVPSGTLSDSYKTGQAVIGLLQNGFNLDVQKQGNAIIGSGACKHFQANGAPAVTPIMFRVEINSSRKMNCQSRSSTAAAASLFMMMFTSYLLQPSTEATQG